MSDPTPTYSGAAFSAPLPSCADCGATFHTLADSFCWNCGGPGPARIPGAAPLPPPGPPERTVERIARDIAAAAAVARPYLLPPPGTTLRALLDELVAACAQETP